MRDFKEYITYSKFYAKKFFGYNHPEYEDAIAEGLLSASKAINQYNPDNETGAQLDTYVTVAIKNGVLLYRRKVESDKILSGISRDEHMELFDDDLVYSYDDTDREIELSKNICIIQDYLETLREKLKKSRGRSAVTYSRMLLIYEKLFVEEKNTYQIEREIGISNEAIRIYKVRLIKGLSKYFKSREVVNGRF